MTQLSCAATTNTIWLPYIFSPKCIFASVGDGLTNIYSAFCIEITVGRSGLQVEKFIGCGKIRKWSKSLLSSKSQTEQCWLESSLDAEQWAQQIVGCSWMLGRENAFLGCAGEKSVWLSFNTIPAEIHTWIIDVSEVSDIFCIQCIFIYVSCSLVLSIKGSWSHFIVKRSQIFGLLQCSDVRMFRDLPLPNQIYPESWALQERQRFNLNQSLNLPGRAHANPFQTQSALCGPISSLV